MATNKMTLCKLLRKVAKEVNKTQDHGIGNPEEVVKQLVKRIPRKDLGELIAQADQYIGPVEVAQCWGYTNRYPLSGEKYLRETLSSIIVVILNLDQM